MSDAAVSMTDLDFLRGVLVRVSTHFQAVDLANAELNLQPVRYRPLTTLIENAVERVDGLISDALMAQYREDADGADPLPSASDEPEPDASEEAESDEQLQLFDPAEYDAPVAVKAARRKRYPLVQEIEE